MRIMDVNYDTMFNATDFGNSKYTCINCINLENRYPVLMLMSKDSNPPHWLVVDEFKQMVYTNYADAMDYCKRMGYLNKRS